MRVLLANNFYYARGGACSYMFALTNLLESKGHEIVPFSMHHPENFDSAYSEYFVSGIDYVESLRRFGIGTGLKVVSRAVYSREAKNKIGRLIDDTVPDIAHLQNIHNHLTPAILYSLKQRNIPVVWTLHDYKMICPNTSFLRDGHVCERCKKTRYYNAPFAKCKKGSFAASLLAGAESYVHRTLNIQKMVDVFVAPSDFLRSKLIEFGLDGRRIVTLPNFIRPVRSTSPVVKGDYVLYSGRLSPEKGADVLIEAARHIKGAHFVIAGDGPERAALEKKAAGVTSSRIDFLGHQSREKMMELTKAARFVVLPSKCYENCPYSILEAFACGKPVVGARTGGVPEMISDGGEGLLFEPGNASDLAEQIQRLFRDDGLLNEMGRKATEKAANKYSPDAYYKKMISVYTSAQDGYAYERSRQKELRP